MKKHLQNIEDPISENIQQANKKGYKYHVITENEIHSYMTKKEAMQDLKSFPGEAELIDQNESIIKYGLDEPLNTLNKW
jgi:histidinol phosphatase-like PHP family hydrolase